MSALQQRTKEWIDKAKIQGSTEWLEFRKERIGASDSPIIMGHSPWSTPRELWERKVGLRAEKEETEDMRRGKRLEAEARQEFIRIKNIQVEPDVVLHPQMEWMMASLDGINHKLKVIVEIKCTRNFKDHEDVKKGIVPKKYYAQIQHQIECCGYEGAYYQSYNNGESEIIEVSKDQKFIDEMLEEDYKFWKSVKDFDPPEHDFRDFKQMTSIDWEIYASRWLSTKSQIKKLEQEEEDLRKHLIQISGGENAVGSGIKLSKVIRKGIIDYKGVPELIGIDLEKYRKGPLTTWRLQNAEIFDT